ncbi:hypothetical protein [Pontibacter beigongshangensis]|uniref:hypothetical protein n=1 Tax=Pontibacter beigongshangensis TaxID=2574733 RepID=UPI00164F7BA5|nr:hypothetical protein [Pontibacter beigongshangensis]
MKERPSKESIIAEYLSGETSYRKMGEKYGINFYSIRRWVLRHQGRMKQPPSAKTVKTAPDFLPDESPPTDVKTLQAELRKARLEKQVLLEVIKVAEEELGIPIRKKPGAKQS